MDNGSQPQLVNLIISTTFNSFHTERRFSTDYTVGQLKRLLEGLTGAQPSSMVLHLFNKDGTAAGAMQSDDVQLGSLNLHNGMTVQVSDPTVRVGEFEDVSKVKKFELSEEEYANRAESLRAFKQRHKMGQFDEKEKELKSESVQKKTSEQQALADAITVGSRCLVTVADQPKKRGVVLFKGSTKFKPGIWVGVKYDEPLGKNDGSVDGHRYFECAPNYGAFVRPDSVQVGDFPEEDFMNDEL
ncbi:tubulin-folding cofactor B-like [Paramacrobiotus metropolitanus]|uniref:tubulin-folding cofactor B-like n=1 Tax=Paramacrobiotus metropolitanus TaxID=2943436 RepID=UPI0024456CDC|nr:tubulin-folding cofactor B-like [Paramacrobiotus metropolitanus]